MGIKIIPLGDISLVVGCTNKFNCLENALWYSCSKHQKTFSLIELALIRRKHIAGIQIIVGPLIAGIGWPTQGYDGSEIVWSHLAVATMPEVLK